MHSEWGAISMSRPLDHGRGQPYRWKIAAPPRVVSLRVSAVVRDLIRIAVRIEMPGALRVSFASGQRFKGTAVPGISDCSRSARGILAPAMEMRVAVTDMCARASM